MEVLRANCAGACYGVQRALDMALEAVESHERVCSLGPLIHNPQVVSELQEKGLSVIDSLDEGDPEVVLVRSHGVAPEVLQEIDRQAKKHGKVQDILIEVNIGGEEKKGGVAPAEVIDFAKEVDKYPSVRLKGLMSVLPNVEKDALDAFYLQLSKLYDTLKQTTLDNVDIRYLSAGISNDYDVAVKYGANIVRLGRALFGEREVITNG